MMGAILRSMEMSVKAATGGGRALGTFSPADLDQQRALGHLRVEDGLGVETLS